MAKAKYTKNPAIYIDEFGNPHLNIFLHFFYEKDLPKYKIINTKDNDLDCTKAPDTDSSYTPINSKFDVLPNVSSSDWNYKNAILNELRKNNKKVGFFKQLWNKIQDKIHKGSPIEQVFEEAKKNFIFPTTEELEKSRKSAELLEKFLRDSGQINQADKVHLYKEILASEIVLLKNNINKYLLEEDIIEFMLKSEKGIQIDFLRNFDNILPMDVAKKKIDTDKLLVFDNYAVLYYDPNIDPFRKLKDEEVKRKAADPILFGMITGSNKLYYVTDWVYDDDDITIEKVEKIIGRNSRVINDAMIVNTNYNVDQFINILEKDIINIYSNEVKPASNE